MPPSTRSEDKIEYVSKKELNELMEVQRESILACFRETVKVFITSVTDRVDKLSNDVHEIKASINFTSEINDNKLVIINEHLEILKKELKSTQILQNEISDSSLRSKKKLIDLEDRSRRCNIRLDGVYEHTNESWDDTKAKVKLCLKDNLKISENIEIERAHRIPANDFQRKNKLPRTIVCRLFRYSDKEKVLVKRGLLRETNIYINEDFSEETTRTRKELHFEAKKHRAEGRYARVVYNRLVVHDRKDRSNVQHAEQEGSQ
jgi:transcriptional antiterminator Rof (Rho-off)